MKWHSLTKSKVIKELNTSENGLSNSKAEKRLKKYGKNKISTKNKISPLKIFIKQFTSVLIIILILAAIFSYSIGFIPGQSPHLIDAILILVIVFLNGIFGFVQDYKAEKSITMLKKLSRPKSLILRNGKRKIIDSSKIVPGDVIILKEGDKIPADARIIFERDLKIDESSLTGESIGVQKATKKLKKKTSLEEKKNMVFSNTTVLRGIGKAVVVSTGMDTQIGNIATEISSVKKEKTVFEKEVNKLGKKLGLGIIGIIGIIFLVQVFLGDLGIVKIILTSISLAVAAIPEGLPAVVTLTLALGTRKMAKRNSLVRKLSVIESLGAVNVICSDKTGTMTENKMVVKRIYYNGEMIKVTGNGYAPKGTFLHGTKAIKKKNLQKLTKIGMLCNDSEFDENGKIIGDHTEVALLVSAEKSNLNKKDLDKKYKRYDEIPFSRERKMMSTAHKYKNKKNLFSKGATDVLLKKCSRIYREGKIKKLSNRERQKIKQMNEKMASQGLRVLAFAYKPLRKKVHEKNLVFVGLQGMMDPPRKEVKKALESCKQAGIRTIMITGDHKLTASSIANELGLKGDVLEGRDLEKLSEKQLQRKIKTTNVFARVNPSEKVKILKALKNQQSVVAMTGDGVNDAPALKNADVGISMGKKGTDIAKQTSDMILLDDNFATIKEAVKQGRAIFDNIQKFVNYLLTSNIAEVITVFIISLFGYLPVTAVQLLWINLLTDGMPALALGADPPRKNIMKEKPRGKNESVITQKMIYLMGGIGSLLSILLVSIFFLSIDKGIIYAQTMVFTGLVFFELARIVSIKYNENMSLLKNKWLAFALGLSIFLQLIVIYSPLNTLFGVTPLGINGWVLILTGLVAAIILSIGATKVVKKIIN